jgi:hypothetical protein
MGRARGQEVVVMVTRGAQLEAEFTDVMSFNAEDTFELKEQGFLGQKSKQYDTIYNGSKFDLEMQLHSTDWWKFKAAVRAKATREQPDIVFNISTLLEFDNGQSALVTFPDVSFGPMPENVPAREDYVKVKLSGACSLPLDQLS